MTSAQYTPLPSNPQHDEEAGLPPPPSYGAAATADSDGSAVHFEAKVFLVQSTMAIRMAFVRKVYSILAAQLGLTTIVSALFMYNQDIKTVVQSK